MAKTFTLKQFIEESHINAKLIRAVVRQVGGWEVFKERANDVSRYGASGGVCGFVYYDETVPFFKKNKAEIMQLVENLADGLGESQMKLIASFNCLKTDEQTVAEAIYNPRTEDPEKVRNALAWFALEEVARSYADLTEND